MYELTKAEDKHHFKKLYTVYIQFNMPLISIARLRFLQPKCKKIHANFRIMHWTFSSILFHFLKLQLAWIHFTFCVLALWEESIWSPLCPTIPFSVASLHTFFFFLYFPPHDSTALQPSASPVPLPPQPAWSLPLLLTTLTPPTSWRCEGESRPLHNNPRPFLSLPVPHTNSFPGLTHYCLCFLLLSVELEKGAEYWGIYTTLFW